MGQRTDTRDRIIKASLQAMREKGYGATAISDIVDASGAPRGSVTFHFKGGKDEIAREVIALRTAQVLGALDQVAAESTSAADLLGTSIDRIAAEFADSGFVLGCPVVPITIERAAQAPEIRQAGAEFFQAWCASLVRGLTSHGIDATRADRIAILAVTAAEGALAISRVEQSPAVFTAVREELMALVTP
ncbi:TetR/AcrR family transcriptional regulator [Amycolatopsis jiangsuensis]|uniref:TetR/AcrR family transcriptional repressor of lmrAB and yxaGH operons n=1 Tax=Amycolatopsis jiangsuensis TaxID=1181879 RepID=A0A840ISP5_9PSEU|nr:TetR/AcrR family transcriptional regulator [Amycolatopsis jiangsuensis]MBB4684397.1 TetR/AcrR family transcriptional repressor of lmrAB and yxaGH operons [Amycolatopsis jiangsuensis]